MGIRTYAKIVDGLGTMIFKIHGSIVLTVQFSLESYNLEQIYIDNIDRVIDFAKNQQ